MYKIISDELKKMSDSLNDNKETIDSVLNLDEDTLSVEDREIIQQFRTNANELLKQLNNTTFTNTVNVVDE